MERYFIDKGAVLGGVVIAEGKVRIINMIVAADTIRTKSELLIVGAYTSTRLSNISVYRTAVLTLLAIQVSAFR